MEFILWVLEFNNSKVTNMFEKKAPYLKLYLLILVVALHLINVLMHISGIWIIKIIQYFLEIYWYFITSIMYNG